MYVSPSCSMKRTDTAKDECIGIDAPDSRTATLWTSYTSQRYEMDDLRDVDVGLFAPEILLL